MPIACAEILKRFRSDFFKRNRGFTGGEPPDRRAVAKNDDLSRVLYHLIAASVDFTHEALHASKALNIPRLTPDHGAFLHGLGCE